jgi:hypothetical protein
LPELPRAGAVERYPWVGGGVGPGTRYADARGFKSRRGDEGGYDTTGVAGALPGLISLGRVVRLHGLLLRGPGEVVAAGTKRGDTRPRDPAED